MVNSRAKGARGERELARTLTELFGWNARRTCQFSGNAGDSDVVIEELPDVFVEVKLVENLSLVPVMRKAVEQCKEKLPIICHRKKNTDFLVTLRLSDLVAISKMVCRLELDTRPALGSTRLDTDTST
jgi:hypothetical protein